MVEVKMQRDEKGGITAAFSVPSYSVNELFWNAVELQHVWVKKRQSYMLQHAASYTVWSVYIWSEGGCCILG